MADPQDEIDALTAQVAALTKRVYELERKAGVEWVPTPAPSAPIHSEVLRPTEAPAEPASIPAPPPAAPAQTVPQNQSPDFRAPGFSRPEAPSSRTSRPVPRADVDLEKTIGQYWLNRIGIVAILIGVSYFLKYAFENNWIGPSGRVVIGLLTGIGLVLWSESFRAKGYQAFSYSLKAVGIGTLYLSLWGAFQVYHLIPAAAAFASMAMVTAATIALALTQDAELLATFALVGGFSTPILLSTGQNHEVVLFSYVALLDIAVLALAIGKPWRRLLWGSFAGTILLYVGWYSDYYSADQRATTVLFATVFFLLFACIPLATPYNESQRFTGASVTLTVMPLLNAGAFFLALYQVYDGETATLTWYALGLAAVYLAIGSAFRRRFPGQDNTFLNLLHIGIAIAFITIAIPLKLDGQWITIGWLIESAVLLWISVKVRTDFLRFLAVAALALGIGRLLLIDRFQTDTLIFNARFATYLVAIAVLGGIIVFGNKHASQREKPFLQIAAVLLNLLALVALTLEASDYFDRQLATLHHVIFAAPFTQLRLERDFSYSAIWLVYGVALMAVGFGRKSSFVRWQSLVLIAATIAKVFLYDVSALDKGYRILSFVALGAVLLAISFVYQRDWLKLSTNSTDSRAGEPS